MTPSERALRAFADDTLTSLGEVHVGRARELAADARAVTEAALRQYARRIMRDPEMRKAGPATAERAALELTASRRGVPTAVGAYIDAWGPEHVEQLALDAVRAVLRADEGADALRRRMLALVGG